MKTAKQTALHILGVIDHAYARPQMYGRTADEFESVIWVYHKMLGFIQDRASEFSAARSEVAKAARCPASQDFAGYYRQRYSRASEGKVLGYVISKWRQIDRLLELDLPEASPGKTSHRQKRRAP